MPAERVALSFHLDPLTTEQRQLWERFAGFAEGRRVQLVATKSRIAFKAERIFAGGFFRSGRLEIFFDLPEPVPEADRDGRFLAVWQQGPRLWTHRLRLASLDDLDGRLADWLDEARSVYSLPAGER